jgi:hypothetical protein
MRHTQKPASPKQLAANRANAAHSSGPKTPEGKARSAQNSLKHGFTASTFAVVRLEDLQEIAHLKFDLVSVYQPVNSQELFALERMALSQQAILRAARLESGLFTTSLNETLDSNDHPFTPMSKELAGDGSIEITRAQNRNYCLADGFLRLVRQSNGWSIFLRYQAQAERQYRRALEDFDRLKALRHDLPNEELPNEPISGIQTQHEPATYSSPETNPPPQQNIPSAPFAGDPELCRSPHHPAPYSPAARLVHHDRLDPSADPPVSLSEPPTPRLVEAIPRLSICGRSSVGPPSEARPYAPPTPCRRRTSEVTYKFRRRRIPQKTQLPTFVSRADRQFATTAGAICFRLAVATPVEVP